MSKFSKKLSVALLALLLVFAVAACSGGATYKVSFDTDGGSAVTAQTVSGGGSAIKPQNPTKAGYQFDDWYKDSDKTVSFNFETEKVSADTTVYAKWLANDYSVAYDKNAFDAKGSTGNTGHTYGAAKNLAVNGYVLPNHIFAGWNTKADGSGTKYSDGQSVTNLSAENGATVTLYAQWEAGGIAGRYYGIGEYNGDLNLPRYWRFNLTLDDEGTGEVLVDGSFEGVLWESVLEGFGLPVPCPVTYVVADGQIMIFVAEYDEETPLVVGTLENGNIMNATLMEVVADLEKQPDAAGVYTVAFETGAGSDIVSQQISGGGKVIRPSINPERTGYRFGGWHTSDSYTASFDFVNTQISAATVVYAKWVANNYTIIYNANTGTGGATANSRHTYDAAKALTANGFIKTGYTFAGWATSAGGDVVYSDGQSVTNLTAVNEAIASPAVAASVTLYAKWTANSYTVAYDRNGGDGGEDMASGAHTYGTPDALTLNTYTKAGFAFAGWTTSADGSGMNYADEASVTNLTALNNVTVTLYAQWLENSKVLVTFNTGLGSGIVAQQIASGGTATQPVTNPTRTGYTFGGWYTTSGLGTAVNFSDAISADTTVYAKWTANTYTIAFDRNGTTGTTASTNHTYDAVSTSGITTTANPARTGYSFLGWCTDINGNGTLYQRTATAGSGTAVLNLTAVNGATVTLYAIWTNLADTGCIATFIANGDDVTGEMPDLIYTYNAEYNLPVNQYKREGYVFLGWNTTSASSAAGLTINFVDGGRVNNNLTYAARTFWAVWELVVTCNLNGGALDNEPLYNIGDMLTGLGTPVKEGYAFAGWYLNNTFTTPLPAAPSLIVLTASTTLYAKWIGNDYTVQFNTNGGTGTMANESFVYGTSKVLPDNTFTRTGYNFVGWNTGADGRGTWLNDKQAIIALTSDRNSTVILYAQWIIDNYTISYDANGGTGAAIADETRAYNDGGSLTSSEFTLAGFAFIGWNTYADGSGVGYSVGYTGDIHAQSANVTLYAQWLPIGSFQLVTPDKATVNSNVLYNDEIFHGMYTGSTSSFSATVAMLFNGDGTGNYRIGEATHFGIFTYTISGTTLTVLADNILGDEYLSLACTLNEDGSITAKYMGATIMLYKQQLITDITTFENRTCVVAGIGMDSTTLTWEFGSVQEQVITGRGGKVVYTTKSVILVKNSGTMICYFEIVDTDTIIVTRIYTTVQDTKTLNFAAKTTLIKTA